MHSKDKLVSICFPVFNKSKYLVSSIQSILDQSYPNIEVIVIDNDSTDDSYDKIKKNFSNFKNIKIFKNEKNIGYNRNYNKCIELSKGDYIGIFHSDDIYDSNIVEKSVNLLSSDKNIGFTCSYGERIDEDGTITGDYTIPKQLKKLKKNTFNFDEIFSAILTQGNVIATATVIVKKNVFDEVGVFDNYFEATADYDLWLRILSKYKIGILNEKLFKWREHKNQISAYTLRDWKIKPPELKVYEKYKNLSNKYKKLFSNYKDKRIIFNAINLNKNRDFYNSQILLQDISFFKSNKINLSKKIFLVIINLLRLSISENLVIILKRLNNTNCSLNNYLKNYLRKIFYLEFWKIGIIDIDIDNFIKNNDLKNYKIRFLKNNLNSRYAFDADPFFYSNKDKTYIIAERFNYFDGRGAISSYELVNSNLIFHKNLISNTKLHYSYPYTYYDQEKFWILYECFQQKSIRLLKLDKNFNKVDEIILVDNFAGVDTSLSYFNNKYWIFSNEYSDTNVSKLYIWYSDKIEGPWLPQKNNPVKKSSYNSRNAGRIFMYNDKLIRPSQNNTRSYGGSIILNQINKLSEQHFDEKKLLEIYPPLSYSGIHHIDIMDNKIIFDFKYSSFNILSILFKIYQRMLIRKFTKF